MGSNDEKRLKDASEVNFLPALSATAIELAVMQDLIPLRHAIEEYAIGLIDNEQLNNISIDIMKKAWAAMLQAPDFATSFCIGECYKKEFVKLRKVLVFILLERAHSYHRNSLVTS
jgi:hypothetical protein